jgi:hypothetical protein
MAAAVLSALGDNCWGGSHDGVELRDIHRILSANTFRKKYRGATMRPSACCTSVAHSSCSPLPVLSDDQALDFAGTIEDAKGARMAEQALDLTTARPPKSWTASSIALNAASDETSLAIAERENASAGARVIRNQNPFSRKSFPKERISRRDINQG